MEKIQIFLLLVGLVDFITCQRIRALPNPLISIHCGQNSFIRHVNLVPTTRPNQAVPTTCTYRIHAISGFICQMRFEFHEFSLLPPETTPYPACTKESMKVGNVSLCGINNGQHIYVPINPLKGERFLEVTFNTQQSMSSFEPRSSWKISVHQFECPLGQARMTKASAQQVNDKSSQVAHPVRQPRLGIFSDWLAPFGCLQYFNQPNGTVESFNLNNGVGPYIGDMNYAICFRRTRADTSIRFIPVIFRMAFAFTNDTNTGYDEACFSSTPTIGRSEDYLFIPNAVTDGTDTAPPIRATRFCAESVLGQTITSSTPAGPFMIHFNSDRVYDSSTKEEIGFRFTYEIA